MNRQLEGKLKEATVIFILTKKPQLYQIFNIKEILLYFKDKI